MTQTKILTETERERLIERVLEADVDCYREPEILADLLRYGFKGYADMTDRELLERAKDHLITEDPDEEGVAGVVAYLFRDLKDNPPS